MDAKHPAAEVEVDESLIRTLLEEQHPDLADEALVFVDAGWDNTTHRVGAELAIRIPRREVAVELLLNERRWLPVLGPRIRVPVPMPMRTGEPSDLFRWPWNVVQWISGNTADTEPLTADQAPHLGHALQALHAPAPNEAPRNPFRGVPLQSRDEAVRKRISGVEHRPAEDVNKLEEYWSEGLEVSRADQAVWLHGDLHPRNVLVRKGRLVGIIDWGDLTAGDPATDLAAAWTLFDSAEARQALWDVYGATDDLIVRSRAWAVFFGTMLSCSGEDRHESIGRSILGNVLGRQT